MIWSFLVILKVFVWYKCCLGFFCLIGVWVEFFLLLVVLIIILGIIIVLWVLLCDVGLLVKVGVVGMGGEIVCCEVFLVLCMFLIVFWWDKWIELGVGLFLSWLILIGSWMINNWVFMSFSIFFMVVFFW